MLRSIATFVTLGADIYLEVLCNAWKLKEDMLTFDTIRLRNVMTVMICLCFVCIFQLRMTCVFVERICMSH